MIREYLEKITDWQYESVIKHIENLQKTIIHAFKQINTRIPEIVSDELADIIKMVNQELENQRKDLVESLNDLFQSYGTSSSDLYTKKCSTLKYEIYKSAVLLEHLIWVDEIRHGDIGIFESILPSIAGFACDWITRHCSYVDDETSGLFMTEYILDQCEKFHQNALRDSNPHILKTRQSLAEFVKLLPKQPSAEGQTVLSGLNNVKTCFISTYVNWVNSSHQVTKLADIMSFDPAGYTNYDDWFNNLKVMCENSHNVCKLPPKTSIKRETEELLEYVFAQLRGNKLQEDFNKKSTKFIEINKKANKIIEQIHQIGCEKSLVSTHDTAESGRALGEVVKKHHDKQISDHEMGKEVNEKFSQFDSNVDSLQKIVNYITNSQPMPLETIFAIQKEVERIHLRKNVVGLMLNELKRSPENDRLEKKIIEEINQVNADVKAIEDKLVKNLDSDNVLQHLKQILEKDVKDKGHPDLTKAPISKEIKHKIENTLEKLVIKLESEREKCSDPAGKAQIEQNLNTLLKARDYLSQNMNPLFYLNQIKFQKDAQELEELMVTAKIEEAKISVPEVVVSYKVPERFLEAQKIIEQPAQDDRIAVAASELHKQVKLEHVKESSLEAHALEISYMFAEMSELVKKKENPAKLIDIGKQISTDTLKIIEMAKDLMNRCQDKRLKQILNSALSKLPTTCTQLKMLSTLTASRLKAQASQDKESNQQSNEMMIECAENLMRYLKDVVKAAEAAQIKTLPPRSKVTEV
ncbi:Vinculin [Thelohanellus kitauei]|nr:Vinculin [Thelohanellus kitauei]